MDAGVVKNEVKNESHYDEPMDTDEGSEEGEIYSDHESENQNKKLSRNGRERKDVSDEENKLDLIGRKNIQQNAVLLQQSKSEFSKLYTSLGIDENIERHYRLNAIHIRGTQGMDRDDVFEYFDRYAPSYIEYISSNSCNVVWLDDISAAKAMLAVSKEIRDVGMDENEDDNVVNAAGLGITLPAGNWRLGETCPLSSTLLLRFTTLSDVSQAKADNEQNITSSATVSRHRHHHYKKRHKRFRDIPDSSEDMSDQEEAAKEGRKNPWGNLAQSWGKTDKMEPNVELVNRAIRLPFPDLRNTLRTRRPRTKIPRYDDVDSEEDINSKEEENWIGKRKIPRMKMYADEFTKAERVEERKISKAVRNAMVADVEDLRSKLSSKKSEVQTRQSHKHTTKAKTKVLTVIRDETSQSNSESEDLESSDWALEKYEDLRKTLHNHKHRQPGILEKARMKSKAEESERDEGSEEDRQYLREFDKNPELRIEIDNDKYLSVESDD